MKINFEQFQDFDVGVVQTNENVDFHQGTTINVLFDNTQIMAAGFQDDSFSVDFGSSTQSGEYSGPYEVAPSTQTQTLNTINKTLSQNITVKPIPGNYGLITWNGSFLTVS